MDPPPEKQKPVGEWQNKWSDFQQMLVLRVLRPDRVLFAARAFIEANLGREFTEPPQFNLREVFEVSKPSTPLIFILAPGVDPTEAINQLAKEESQRRRAAAEADSKAKGQVFDAGPFSTHDEVRAVHIVDSSANTHPRWYFQLNVHVSHLPLGQGQTPIAEQLLKAGVKKGHWVFLANCHLSIRWMPTLEKLVGACNCGSCRKRCSIEVLGHRWNSLRQILTLMSTPTSACGCLPRLQRTSPSRCYRRR